MKKIDMDGTAVQRVWMKCLENTQKVWMGLGMEGVQYEAEKTFWEMHSRIFLTNFPIS